MNKHKKAISFIDILWSPASIPSFMFSNEREISKGG